MMVVSNQQLIAVNASSGPFRVREPRFVHTQSGSVFKPLRGFSLQALPIADQVLFRVPVTFGSMSAASKTLTPEALLNPDYDWLNTAKAMVTQPEVVDDVVSPAQFRLNSLPSKAAKQGVSLDRIIEARYGPFPSGQPNAVLKRSSQIISELYQRVQTCPKDTPTLKKALQQGIERQVLQLVHWVDFTVGQTLVNHIKAGSLPAKSIDQVKQAARAWSDLSGACRLSPFTMLASDPPYLPAQDHQIWLRLFANPKQLLAVMESPINVTKGSSLRLTVYPGVDPSIRRSVNQALKRLPNPMIEALTTSGLRFEIHPNYSGGCVYQESERRIILSEFHLRLSFARKAERYHTRTFSEHVQFVTLHELGHAWDDDLGLQEQRPDLQTLAKTRSLSKFLKAHQSLARGPQFSVRHMQQAYQLDKPLLCWGEKDVRRLKFLTPTVKEPNPIREVFAELFARHYLPGTGRITEAEFPRMAEAMAPALTV